MGDNPTAGGAGDVTWTLTRILSRPEFKSSNGPSLIYASIPGPELVKSAVAAGAYHKEIDFTRLGLAPRKTDIVVVKIGYLEPELYAMRADWIMALTPGGVDQDIEHLPYKRIQRPYVPLRQEHERPRSFR